MPDSSRLPAASLRRRSSGKHGWRVAASPTHICDALLPLNLMNPEKFVKLYLTTPPLCVWVRLTSICAVFACSQACNAQSYLRVRLLSHPRGLRVQWLHHRSISLDDSSSLALSSIKAVAVDVWGKQGDSGMYRTPPNVLIHVECKEGSDRCPAPYGITPTSKTAGAGACFGVFMINTCLKSSWKA